MFEQANTSPVRPRTGIAIAAVLYIGLRAWPGIFAGAFLVNVPTGVSVTVALEIATGEAGFWSLWSTWWLRNALGAPVITPPLTWVELPRPVWTAKRAAQLHCLTLTSSACAQLAFSDWLFVAAARLADRPSKRYSQHRFATEIAPVCAPETTCHSAPADSRQAPAADHAHPSRPALSEPDT